MNPSKNVRSSAQPGSIANQSTNLHNTVNQSGGLAIMGNTVINTVYYSKNQNTSQTNQNVVNNPTVKSNYNNNMASNQAGSRVPNQSNQNELSMFKKVGNGTQMKPSVVGSNHLSSQNQINNNSLQNTVMKNGKALKNIDINGDTQSGVFSSGNQETKGSISQMNNPFNSNLLNQNNNQSINPKNSSALNPNLSTKNPVQSQINNTLNQNLSTKNPAQSQVNNSLALPGSQNIANLQSQKASTMQSNLNNINASKKPMMSSFPMPPATNLSQNNAQLPNLQPGKNQSALNYPINPQMSNIPKGNPFQSAAINQHPNLHLQSQNMKSVHNAIPQSVNPNQNASVQNSLNPQQLQSTRQSQQVKQSSAQSQVNNSLQNQISQNPNINIQNSKEQIRESMQKSKINNSSIKKSDIRSSRNKSPPMVVKTKDGQIVSAQSDSHGNPYITTETKKSVVQNINDKKDEIKDINNNKKGNGFRFYAQITKAGRNQNNQQKTNQDTPLVHLNVGGIQGFNLFGVLDGHGPHGHFVSQFCRDYFIRKSDEFANQCKRENITDPKHIYEKLKKSNFAFINECFKDADREIMKQNQFEYNFSGTTCNLVFQFLKYLVCASVGDSTSILIYDDGSKTCKNIYPLSHDHKPNLPQEQERILNHGGRIDKLTDPYGSKVGPDRVFKGQLTYPGLAMSRSLGDFQAKDCGVISDPEINEYAINHNAKYMLICSDGIWEFLTHEEVRDLGNSYLQNSDIGKFCSALVQRAVHAWEEKDIIRDDITVVCVYF